MEWSGRVAATLPLWRSKRQESSTVRTESVGNCGSSACRFKAGTAWKLATRGPLGIGGFGALVVVAHVLTVHSAHCSHPSSICHYHTDTHPYFRATTLFSVFLSSHISTIALLAALQHAIADRLLFLAAAE